MVDAGMVGQTALVREAIKISGSTDCRVISDTLRSKFGRGDITLRQIGKIVSRAKKRLVEMEPKQTKVLYSTEDAASEASRIFNEKDETEPVANLSLVVDLALLMYRYGGYEKLVLAMQALKEKIIP